MTRCMKLTECEHEQERVRGRLSVRGSCTCTVQQWNNPTTPNHFICILAWHSCLYNWRWLHFPWVRLPAAFQFQLLFLAHTTLQILTMGTSFPSWEVGLKSFKIFSKNNPAFPIIWLRRTAVLCIFLFCYYYWGILLPIDLLLTN